MRIAVDGRPLCHPHTGIGVYTFELIVRMMREHQLFVYLDRNMRELPNVRALFRMGSGCGLTRLAITHLRFPRWAHRDAVDVFWGPRHDLPLTLGGTPSVVTIHDMMWRQAPDTMRPLNRLSDSMLMPIALAQASRVLAVSVATAEQVRRYSGRRDVVVTPLAARPFAGAASFAHERPFFLWVGQREPRKNLVGIVTAFRLAVERGLSSHDLVLAGPYGWKQEHLSEAIAKSGVADRIVVLGEVSERLLAGAYQACSALVLASFYEGFGIPLLEAMQYGKPVIASNRGAMAEVAGDAALLVDPERPTTIASAFLRLARDAATLRRLATNARRRNESYSWDRTARDTLRVLAAAAQRRTGG